MTGAGPAEQVTDAIGSRVTKKECARVFDAFPDAVKETIARGDRICYSLGREAGRGRLHQRGPRQ